MQIEIDKIIPGENPRSTIDPNELQTLANSLNEHGQLNSIAVEPIENGTYLIIDGNRRYRAAVALGWETIEAHIVTSGNSKARLIRALVGNLHRVDMGPIDEATAFKTILQEMTLEQLAVSLGCSQSHIRNRVWLINGDLSPKALDLMNRKLIPIDYGMVTMLRKLSFTQQDIVLTVAEGSPATSGTVKAAISRVCRKVPLQAPDPRPEVKTDNIPALRVVKMILPPQYQDLSPHLARVCQEWCGMAGGSSRICRDCPLTELMRDIGRKEHAA
jgi:ParB family chromosome partitioning protein